MSPIITVSSRPRHGSRAEKAFLRLAALLAALVQLLATAPSEVAGQDEPQVQPTAMKRWELLVPSGLLVPTGEQRQALKRANLTALQVSYLVHPSLAVAATLGWARSRDVAAVGHPKLDVFTYDLGAELRGPRWDGAVGFRPFVGVGAGARSYNYRSLDLDATHNPAVYAGLGGELTKGRLGLRVEARDYVTGFAPLDGQGRSDVRGDVVLMAGLRFDWR